MYGNRYSCIMFYFLQKPDKHLVHMSYFNRHVLIIELLQMFQPICKFSVVKLLSWKEPLLKKYCYYHYYFISLLLLLLSISMLSLSVLFLMKQGCGGVWRSAKSLERLRIKEIVPSRSG